MTNSRNSKTSAGASSAHGNNNQQEARNMRQARAARQQAAANVGERRARPQPDVALACPRCNATETKFCYYNNYNMLQPRYLCKACKRYWTHGGSQRNIPVGGASRKQNKRSSASSSLPAAAASSSSVINKELQQQLLPAAPMIEAAADFSNVFPSFMPTGFEHHSNQLPFSPAPAPLPLPTLLPPVPMLASDAGTPSFLDMLRGGFLDYQTNGFYAPATASSGMEAPPPLPFGPAVQPGVAGILQGGGAAPTGGRVDATAAGQGAAWPKPQVRGNQQGGAGAPGNGRA